MSETDPPTSFVPTLVERSEGEIDYILEIMKLFLRQAEPQQRNIKRLVTKKMRDMLPFLKCSNIKIFLRDKIKEAAEAEGVEIIVNEPCWIDVNQLYIEYLLNRNNQDSSNSPSSKYTSIESTPQSSASSGTSKANDMTQDSYAEFTRNFRRMEINKMWKVSSETTVETTMYQVELTYKKENLIHSFILDLDDIYLCSKFEKEELLVMSRHNLQPVPAAESDLKVELDLTKTKGYNDLLDFSREKLMKYTLADNRFYVHLSVINLLTVFYDEFFGKKNSETDVMVGIWINFLDLQFRNCKTLNCLRGEICCLASAERKMVQHPESNRKPLGHRGDAIIKSSLGNHEFSYGEANISTDQTSSKNVYDGGLKAKKAIQDIYGKLEEAIEFNEQARRKIRVPGFLCAMYSVKLIIMENPDGYILRPRDYKVVNLTGSKESFPEEFANIFELFHILKLVCLENQELLNEHKPAALGFNTPAALQEMELAPGLRTPPRPESEGSNKKQKTK